MMIERYEKIFMKLAAVFLFGAVAALVVSIAGGHASLPEPAGRIEPEQVRDTAPFDQPGVREATADEKDEFDYKVTMVAQAWQWDPPAVEVPQGKRVRFEVTTVDVIHGFYIPNTQANAMIIPGQITELDLTFDESGQHSLICHEYCGIQHHNMGGKINVTPAEK
ncbi:MAG: hypothetical protein R2754_09800 [Microthrixaceae bacterium]